MQSAPGQKLEGRIDKKLMMASRLLAPNPKIGNYKSSRVSDYNHSALSSNVLVS